VTGTPTYSTLLAGAADGLDAVRCIYLDDLEHLNAAKAWALALEVFEQCRVSPGKVGYTEGHDAKHVTPATFERRVPNLEIDSLTVAAATDDQISQVYEAPTYVGIDLRPGRSALFFYSDQLPNHSLADWATSDPIQSIGYAAAYAFDFALSFSPSAYFWGLGYSPNRRRLGEVTRTDVRRLECWGHNQRRGLRPSQGYLRDIYEQNLLSELHLTRSVGGTPLNRWIRETRTGSLDPVAGRWLWTLTPEEIHRSRFALNQAGLLLSGRDLEMQS
jgi:hypothetical protein